MPRIHLPQDLTADSRIVLRDSAFAHVVRVLRLKAGDAVVLFNGDGREWQAQITAIDRREATVHVQQSTAPASESPLVTHLLQAVGKGDRMDWAVQKATELGVSSIRPVVTARCNVRLDDERWQRKREHWQAVAISACEQCGRVRIPEVHAVADLPAALQACSPQALRLVLHQHGAPLPPGSDRPAAVCVLIGPEGGLTAEELDSAQRAGFHRWALGPRVLRTETAPVVGLSVLQARYGDFRA